MCCSRTLTDDEQKQLEDLREHCEYLEYKNATLKRQLKEMFDRDVKMDALCGDLERISSDKSDENDEHPLKAMEAKLARLQKKNGQLENELMEASRIDDDDMMVCKSDSPCTVIQCLPAQWRLTWPVAVLGTVNGRHEFALGAALTWVDGKLSLAQ